MFEKRENRFDTRTIHRVKRYNIDGGRVQYEKRIRYKIKKKLL